MGHYILVPVSRQTRRASSLKRRLSLRQAIQRISLIEFASVLLLSALFSISVVLSNHICITGGTYAGTIEENYITPYSMTDFATFVVVFAASFIIVMLTHMAHAVNYWQGPQGNKLIFARLRQDPFYSTQDA